ncbi:CBS domain-containing protein [Tistrella sp.]|nr:CBS domain-containing protein [Tistrella sp.]
MNRNIQLATPNESLRAVAERMADCDIGYMPVGENDRLVGVLSLADSALGYSPDSTGTAMTGVVVPGGAHNQSRAGHGAAGNGGGGR